MSWLLRPFLSARYFFLTVNLLSSKSKLEERDFQRLAFSVARMQEKHGSAVRAEDRLRAPALRSEDTDLSPRAADRPNRSSLRAFSRDLRLPCKNYPRCQRRQLLILAPGSYYSGTERRDSLPQGVN